VQQASAVVTARDGLVIGIEPKEVLERIGALRDRERSDVDLRTTLLARSRGQKYARGDTRSWKLADARRMLRHDREWETYVRRCSYRPLDDRWIYWHPGMIDWPREAVSRLMRAGNNPGLIARRQSPRLGDGHFYWVTRWPTIDGIVRSDNRGNEFVFPLFGDANRSACNFSQQWIELAERRLGMTLNSESAHPIVDRRPTLGSLFDMMIAMLFSASYREMHQDVTRHEFIPMLVPRDDGFFESLARHGAKLVRLLTENEREYSAEPDVADASAAEVEPPRFDGDRVWSGNTVLASGMSAGDWTFRAGCHQVCRKWLLGRRGRPITHSLTKAYANVCLKVRSIRTECRQIEESVRASGGWRRWLR
jgi:hypothetical protein